MVAKGCVDQGRLKRGASRQPGKLLNRTAVTVSTRWMHGVLNSVQPTDDSMEIIGAGQLRFVLNGE